MAKITLSEAVKIIPVSESTLRPHMRTGKVSSEKDHNGRNLFDTAELARVYGDLKLNGTRPLSDEPVQSRILMNRPLWRFPSAPLLHLHDRSPSVM